MKIRESANPESRESQRTIGSARRQRVSRAVSSRSFTKLTRHEHYERSRPNRQDLPDRHLLWVDLAGSVNVDVALLAQALRLTVHQNGAPGLGYEEEVDCLYGDSEDELEPELQTKGGQRDGEKSRE